MLVRPAALLCMDEPTNHLDLASREVLEQALATFPGTIVFISHDRYFINRLATTIVEIVRGILTRHLGNYDDYLAAKTRAAADATPGEGVGGGSSARYPTRPPPPPTPSPLHNARSTRAPPRPPKHRKAARQAATRPRSPRPGGRADCPPPASTPPPGPVRAVRARGRWGARPTPCAGERWGGRRAGRQAGVERCLIVVPALPGRALLSGPLAFLWLRPGCSRRAGVAYGRGG